MHFVVISGRSGSGKSSALQLLEDVDFTCVDNLPVSLLPELVAKVAQAPNAESRRFAVGIDARDMGGDLNRFPEILTTIQTTGITGTIIFLDASDSILIKRFSETRRKHPLTNKNLGLNEAIKLEGEVLKPIAKLADITIDTSTLTLHELRRIVKAAVGGGKKNSMALMLESFGFKYGAPINADFIFDVRSLPNPHWRADLRDHTGLEQPVIEFLGQQEQVESMFDDISTFLEKWIPSFQDNSRSYLTVAIGCTGGRHRSVYLTEKLAQFFKSRLDNVQTRHRQLVQTHETGAPHL